MGPGTSRSLGPSPGNHDYDTPGASGYFGYFGAAAGDPTKGYYSYEIGDDWLAYSLNSNCADVPVCGSGSAQVQWLRSELAANTDKNVLAYWHHARFSTGIHGNGPEVSELWEAWYDFNADVVIAGHAHSYERNAPLAPNGQQDAMGMRSFVVGTGGTGLTGWTRGTESWTKSRQSSDHGVLKLILAAGSYSWEFVPVAGKSFNDSGTSSVVPNGGAPPPPPPPDPSEVGGCGCDVEVPGEWLKSGLDVALGRLQRCKLVVGCRPPRLWRW